MTPPITRRCLECGETFSYTPIINFGQEYFLRVRCGKCDQAVAEKLPKDWGKFPPPDPDFIPADPNVGLPPIEDIIEAERKQGRIYKPL